MGQVPLHKRAGAHSPKSADHGVPLSDRRFEELLKKASEFFAAEEIDPEAQKQAAIQEILAEMARYGLTTDDLM
jgi:hypothetical protein